MRRVLPLVLIATLLSACGGSPSPEPVVHHVSMKLTDSSTAFGLTLLDRLLEEPGADNVFISPLSATLMLSMAASAADGDTRASMLKTLDLDPALDPSGQIHDTIDRLAQSDANAQLELAQAVWVQKNLVLSPADVTKLRNDYRAELSNLDFTAPDAPDIVNRWVDGATHHKIAKLVDSFDPTTVGYLVNATYFHALWRTEFSPDGNGDFETFSGNRSTVPRMQRSDDVTELTTPDYEAAVLPYRGGRFSAVIVLPRSHLSAGDFGTFLTAARWAQVLSFLHTATGQSLGGDCSPPKNAIAPDAGIGCDGTLVMPKFQLDYKKDLTNTLRAMGMALPGALPAFCGGCALSQVVQKTYLQVDEKGTTAAAASGGAVTSAYREPMIVDHPFVFALIDNATDAPLFIGAIGIL